MYTHEDNIDHSCPPGIVSYETSATNNRAWIGALADATSADDNNTRMIQAFIDQYPHPNWTLTLYDTISGTVQATDTEQNQLAAVATAFVALETPANIIFIQTSHETGTYIVGYPFSASNGRRQKQPKKKR